MRLPANRKSVSTALDEVLQFARETFVTDKIRFMLTALCMLIGTASLILVTTISLAGKQYVMSEIRSIGSNWIYVEHPSVGSGPSIAADDLTIGDMEAVENQVDGVVAASPVYLPVIERVSVGNGKLQTFQVMGVYPAYRQVRNLVVSSGRFFDQDDSNVYAKVGVLNAKLATQLYSSPQAAVGRTIQVGGLPFVVIGTFREKVNTFGQSEVSDITMLVPHTVVRYLQTSPLVKQIFFSAANPTLVGPITEQAKQIIKSRHRPEAMYDVRNLTELLSVANKTANALTAALLAVSFVVLIVSGIGIMNIMLDTVRQRIREIGVRKALGATSRDIKLQFLSEAVLISLVGGSLGVVAGFAIPLSIRFLTQYRIPVSGIAALVALVTCSSVGLLFGTLPAARAAQLDPAQSLRYE
jgi:putative ABC transport system permease protein